MCYLETSYCLPGSLTKNQHGFRKGQSTETVIHSLSHAIENTRANNREGIGIFLDIELAFDALSFKAL